MTLGKFLFKTRYLIVILITILTCEAVLLSLSLLHVLDETTLPLISRSVMLHYAGILSLNIVLLTVLWLCVLAYHRYAFSSNVLNLIKGSSPDQSTSVKALTSQVQAYLQERDLMLSALAHDIKTPLTEAQLRLELLEDQSTAKQVQEKLHQIHKIVRSSLEYAREPSSLKKISVDIISLLESIVEDYQDGVFDITFSSNVESLELDVEVDLFRRMMSNVIENAKKYANHGRVIAHAQKDQFDIICEDDGPGVPEKFLPLLTTAYFRVDQSRSRETGGTGLGLAIVKKIAELHNGKVIIEPPVSGQGFKIIMRFPYTPLN